MFPQVYVNHSGLGWCHFLSGPMFFPGGVWCHFLSGSMFLSGVYDVTYCLVPCSFQRSCLPPEWGSPSRECMPLEGWVPSPVLTSSSSHCRSVGILLECVLVNFCFPYRSRLTNTVRPYSIWWRSPSSDVTCGATISRSLSLSSRCFSRCAL